MSEDDKDKPGEQSPPESPAPEAEAAAGEIPALPRPEPPVDDAWGSPEPAPEAEPPAAAVDDQWGTPEPAPEVEGPVPAPDPNASLPEIVGAEPRRDDDDGDDDGDGAKKKRFDWSKRSTKIVVIGSLVSVFAATMIVLSWLNSRDYYLECGTEHVRAMRGSKFPWGRTELSGKQWKAISITPESECADATFATRDELSEAFAQMLLIEARARLSSAKADDVDVAEQQLEQALLLTRSMPTKRVTIENLQGDVEYWRAASEISRIIEQLDDAAKRFEQADAKQPPDTSDASEWAGYAAELSKQLRRGPPGRRGEKEPAPDAPPPFSGTDTSPAPVRDSPPREPAPTKPDAPPGTALPPHADAGPPSPTAPDAGLPTGGVLL